MKDVSREIVDYINSFGDELTVKLYILLTDASVRSNQEEFYEWASKMTIPYRPTVADLTSPVAAIRIISTHIARTQK